MTDPPSPRSLAAAAADTDRAVRVFDHAHQWLGRPRKEPLGAEVWVYDERLAHVLLVRHHWRGWVPPGGRVEPDETPRHAAARELFEETGVRADLYDEPAAACVRSYVPGAAPTLGLSYAAVIAAATTLVCEPGQDAAWFPLGNDWPSMFSDDPGRIRWHAERLRNPRPPTP